MGMLAGSLAGEIIFLVCAVDDVALTRELSFLVV
jgi:hypothetical protein